MTSRPPSTPAPMRCGRHAFSARLAVALWLGVLVVAPTVAIAAPPWKTIDVPAALRQPPVGSDGWMTLRCVVHVPEQWRGRSVRLFFEPFDAALEYRINGRFAGRSGSFPPDYRSGLGTADEIDLTADLLRPGDNNLVEVVVCSRGGRTGFNVAIPALLAGDEGIGLGGPWQYAATAEPTGTIPDPAELSAFATVTPASDLRARLRRLDDDGPLPSRDQAGRFRVADGLRVDPILADPLISQPLSLKWDSRGRLWVCQYIQYPEPAGLTMVSRDAFLRSVYDRVPAPPPHHHPGRDRITVHEDTDGDGIPDHHRVFVDGLSLATSCEFDPAGVWVLNPPYLLFYPDADHDDRPDGAPVVHLEGFGIEDSHSVTNNLRRGPDGWLYAAQGSTVTARVRRPGSDAPPVVSTGQCIWRYHPPTGHYEIFAEGGGNAFGVEFDADGRLLSGHNGGDTRGFHYIQGGYSRKGFEKHGELSNPFAFGFFEPIAHHSAPRFTHALVVVDSPALGPTYAGGLLGVAPLQGQVVHAAIRPDRSSLATQDIGIPLSCGDPWFRPVDIQLGPDGAVYVADFYEQRIDHASHYQGRIDRERGRVWRVAARDDAPHALPDLASLADDVLVERLGDPVRWIRRAALEELVARGAAGQRPEIVRRLAAAVPPSTGLLEHLCAAWRLAPPTDAERAAWLGHAAPVVRQWTIRLTGDAGRVSPATLAGLCDLATRETDAAVRSQLAATARRLPVGDSLRVVLAILAADSAVDADDIHVPLSVWWAVERLISLDRDATLAALDHGPAARPLWETRLGRGVLQQRVARRLAAGARGDRVALAPLLDAASDGDARTRLLAGIDEAFAGRPPAALPDELLAAIRRAGGGSRALRLRLGDAATVAEAVARIGDDTAPATERAADVAMLAETRPAAARAALLDLATGSAEPALRATAIAALEGWDDPGIAGQLLDILPAAPPEVAAAVLATLASRAGWANRLLDTVESGAIDRAAFPKAALDRLRLHRGGVDARAARLFGAPGDTARITAATTTEVDRLGAILAAGSGSPVEGRDLFAKSCGTCHRLFGTGGQIGPDLTSHDRGDPRALLVHVVQPSATIREGYETTVIVTGDGRVLSGFVVEEDPGIVVLRLADGRTESLPREVIEDLQRSPESIMPTGLLADYSPQQVRDLFAYLRATQPVPGR
ncbi:MAG: c-type cytochrome [Planctomycetes bacterium]|nr:c-type cytochrome [Planctomycetota bacterium]